MAVHPANCSGGPCLAIASAAGTVDAAANASVAIAGVSPPPPRPISCINAPERRWWRLGWGQYLGGGGGCRSKGGGEHTWGMCRRGRGGTLPRASPSPPLALLPAQPARRRRRTPPRTHHQSPAQPAAAAAARPTDGGVWAGGGERGEADLCHTGRAPRRGRAQTGGQPNRRRAPAGTHPRRDAMRHEAVLASRHIGHSVHKRHIVPASGGGRGCPRTARIQPGARPRPPRPNHSWVQAAPSWGRRRPIRGAP